MIAKPALVVLVASGLLMAAEGGAPFLAGQKVQASHTERLTLPAGGTLRIEHSIGDLSIEGWDRPEVEITTVKSTVAYYPAAEDAKGKAQLDKVHIASAVKGKDVVVTTSYPHRPFPASPPWSRPPVDLEYRIMAPMGAAMVVEHGVGEVHLANVSGDIHADVRNGGITLDLPPESQYGVDAGSHWGGVISDFPGKDHRRFWLIGHQFTAQSADGAHRLVLKAGYGDIIILKARKPQATK